MDISGYVVLGIVMLFLTYLLPQLIRNRQDLADSRLSDRFSADLRILTTAGVPGNGVPVPLVVGASRTYLHGPCLRTEVSFMNRPRLDLVSSSSSQAGGPRASAAARPADRAGRESADLADHDPARRRRAAARRRLVLTLLLLALTGWAWAAVATNAVPAGLALAPTLLLAVVLLLGRRAAAAAGRASRTAPPSRRASAARPAPAARRPRAGSSAAQAGRAEQARPRATAAEHARRPTASAPRHEDSAVRQATTEVLPRPLPRNERHHVGAPQAAAESSDITRGQGLPTVPRLDAIVPAEARALSARAWEPHLSRSWTPVPVPAPTYTLKPTAPRVTGRPAPAEPVADAAVPPDVPESGGRRVAQPTAGGDASRAPDDPAPPLADPGPSGTTAEESSLRQGGGAEPAPTADAAAAGRGEEEAASAHLDLDAVLNRRRAAGE